MKRMLLVAFTAVFALAFSPAVFHPIVAVEKYVQVETADVVRGLKELPNMIKGEVANLVALLENSGLAVGIGIKFNLVNLEDGKEVPFVVEAIKGKPAEKAGGAGGDKKDKK